MPETIKNHPSVDVIIPTYRPGPELRDLLLRLLRQTLAPGNIFIVNTEESAFDKTLVDGLPRVSICHIPKKAFDHGGTRQMALGFSRAAYVLFMTQDARPADKYLVERLLAAVSQPKVRIAYARQLPNASAGVIERYTRSFNYPETSRVKTLGDLPELGIKTFFCSNVAALYERAFLLAGGGFYVPSIFNEDMVFAGKALRSGAAIAYAADARVIHSHNYSARQQFRRNFDNGVSEALHPETFAGLPVAGEGKKLILSTLGYLARTGHLLWIPKLFVQSAAKMAGFYLGRHFHRLPGFMVRAFTDNRSFWEKDHEAEVRAWL